LGTSPLLEAIQLHKLTALAGLEKLLTPFSRFA